MAQTFRLKYGEIKFEDDRISISDKAKNQKYVTLFTTGLWAFIGLKNAFKYAQPSTDFFDLTWAILGLISLIIFVATLFKSTKSILLMDEVISIKLKHRFNNKFLEIRLKNNKLRRVGQIEELEELEEYIEKYYGGLTTK